MSVLDDLPYLYKSFFMQKNTYNPGVFNRTQSMFDCHSNQSKLNRKPIVRLVFD